MINHAEETHHASRYNTIADGRCSIATRLYIDVGHHVIG